VSSAAATSSSTASPVFLLAGGGSGGHLYPGVAVAAALRKQRPNVQCIFLCTERELDRVILEDAGEAFVPQPIVPPTRSVGGLLRFWQAWRSTSDLVRGLLDKHEPAAVLGLGGYAAGVAVKLAGKQGRSTTAILSPDVIPGRANVYLMPFCRRVYLGHDASREHLPGDAVEKSTTTGVPLRPGLLEPVVKSEAAARLGLDPHLNTLVVTGASQGAKTVNDAIIEVVRSYTKKDGDILQGWQVLHLAGRELGDGVRTAWRSTGLNGRANVIDFTPDMRDIWSVADLAISRSGAGSCAEIAAFGVPSILMPYPFHKDMHQRANGQILAEVGAAVLLEDRQTADANAEALSPVLDSLLYDTERRQSMRQQARSVARLDAADAVASDLLQQVDASASG
jgi:UDP-N-acetylglucosamine--N-acetylmuramyl-(pentapeptide) pyrophosphoryl-undecaprenol N-acetylglucosamine transferase